ncbi:hypothetical protein [Chamaesiphon sp. VAR_48_metabat_403]|uniref:hypothetical protein n=1 Tax=Chamaesiphon sp. VAR_48_metabat_403 TaxID=2964700 RepID=UPI00286E9E4F|nr:hypothetical protein [Chamaesiphon sp. VAR_48_metabat_403]
MRVLDGYPCRGEDSPLYKRDVDPTTKFPVFVGGDSLQENRQVVAVESQILDEELNVDVELDVDIGEE